jgi:uncharacterized protein (TIGR02145 family)
MKHLYLLLSLFTVASSQAQTAQDTLYAWKSGVLVNKQSLKTADLDSITFKRPKPNSNSLNVPGPNVKDIDGNVYQSVTNCNQTWIKTNLNVSKYSDGTPIPQVTDPAAWFNTRTGAWCYYQNSTANGTIYGKLYNWYAVAGIYDYASETNPALRKKLAPTGWHVASDIEWTTLITCLGGESVAGGKMKATGTSLWNTPNTTATNESGFTALPGGYCDYFQKFSTIGDNGCWWTSRTNPSNSSLNTSNGSIIRGSFTMAFGVSVRCVKD